MRKSLFLLCGLLLLAVVGLVGAHSGVNQYRDAVTIRETAVSGDPQAAQGIVLTNQASYRRFLFWETTCRIGGAEGPETDFEFVPTGKDEPYHGSESVNIYFSANFGMSGDLDLESEAERNDPSLLMKPVLDVAGRAPDGQEYREQVYLADYYDVYPLSMDFYGLAASFSITPETQQAIAGYFRIPVPREHLVEITINKDSQGNVYNVDCNSLAGEPVLETSAVFTEAGCYLALSVSGAEGGVLPQARDSGIHFLPFAENPEGIIEPDAAKMKLVYAFEPDVQTPYLSLSPDGESLLLFAKTGRGAELYALELGSLETLWEIPFNGGEEESVYQVDLYGDFFIAISDSRVLVFTGDTGSGFRLELAVRLQDIQEVERWRIYEAAMDYDGQRLVIASYKDPYEGCDTRLLVFDRSGQFVYRGEYEYSFNQAPAYSYAQTCHPWGPSPIQVACR